jgi:hypothetical protein
MKVGKSYLAILSVLVCFALSPRAQAATHAPDGCHAGDDTA